MNLRFSIGQHQIEFSHRWQSTLLGEIGVSMAGIFYGIFKFYFSTDGNSKAHTSGAKFLSTLLEGSRNFRINLAAKANEAAQPNLTTLLDRIAYHPSGRYRNISKNITVPI